MGIECPTFAVGFCSVLAHRSLLIDACSLGLVRPTEPDERFSRRARVGVHPVATESMSRASLKCLGKAVAMPPTVHCGAETEPVERHRKP